MSLQLLVSNPPRSTKRAKRRKVRRSKARVRNNPRGGLMAKKKVRRRARRSGASPFAKKRRSSRFKRRSSSGGSRSIAGFIDTSLLTGGAAGLAGYVGVGYLMERLPATWLNSDAKRIAAKIGVSLLAAFALRKVGMGRFAAGIATGGLVAAGVDAARKWGVPGVSGLGEFGIDTSASNLMYAGGAPINMLPGGDEQLNGLGADLGEDEYEEIVVVQDEN